ncbi:sigma-70 family RNA polymerase sigma factor [Paenibacillus chitinolyticus]|uniref:sigma-70 family RNA polymerase sigma factor n=1 Tax=Paenibacillus chitinolyticus TaxID=79263 RepID=UPI003D05FFBA
MDSLIKANEGLVHQVINDLLYIPHNIEREDLEQVGKIALWEAIQSYDENCEHKLSTHCYRKIYLEIIDYLRKSQAKKRQEIFIKGGMAEDFSEDIIGNLLMDEIKRFLPGDHSNLFFDKSVGDMTYSQLSNKYGLSNRQARYKFKKAVEILRDNIVWEENR